MVEWNDDEIQERLPELSRMNSDEIEGRFGELTALRIEAHLDLDRRLRQLEPSVTLPPDFAVRVAEKAGVLRSVSSAQEQWLAAATFGLFAVAYLFFLVPRLGRVLTLMTDSVPVADPSGMMLLGVLACCGAILASAGLDGWLVRRQAGA
jgi:hypothetical protein